MGSGSASRTEDRTALWWRFDHYWAAPLSKRSLSKIAHIRACTAPVVRSVRVPSRHHRLFEAPGMAWDGPERVEAFISRRVMDSWVDPREPYRSGLWAASTSAVRRSTAGIHSWIFC